jgi:hypothetical protein
MADIPQNIDHFNRVVLQFLSRLYESFPRPINIDASTAIGIASRAVPDSATEEEAWNIGTMVEDVIPWLEEEGFLRYEPDPNHRAGMYWKVRLTLKGLTILGYVPSSLQPAEPKEPLIQKAKQAMASAASTAGKETMKHVVAEIFRLALTHGAVIAKSIVP